MFPLASGEPSTVPADYKGQPFQDSVYKAGAQGIPGIVQCALYDLGGEGVAYHDTDAINHGSGELNAQAQHQRPHAGPYIWGFRKDEGVDLSYVKDFADLNHPNAVSPLGQPVLYRLDQRRGMVQLHGRREGRGHLQDPGLVLERRQHDHL